MICRAVFLHIYNIPNLPSVAFFLSCPSVSLSGFQSLIYLATCNTIQAQYYKHNTMRGEYEYASPWWRAWLGALDGIGLCPRWGTGHSGRTAATLDPSPTPSPCLPLFPPIVPSPSGPNIGPKSAPSAHIPNTWALGGRSVVGVWLREALSGSRCRFPGGGGPLGVGAVGEWGWMGDHGVAVGVLFPNQRRRLRGQ